MAISERRNTERHHRVQLADCTAAEAAFLVRLWWGEQYRNESDDAIVAGWRAWKRRDPMPEFNPEGPQRVEPAVPF